MFNVVDYKQYICTNIYALYIYQEQQQKELQRQFEESIRQQRLQLKMAKKAEEDAQTAALHAHQSKLAKV